MLWLLEHVDQISFPQIEPLLPRLSEPRRRRVEAVKFEAAKVQITLAELLLRHGLEREYGLKYLPRMESGEKGKPFFPDLPALHFNLSHCKTTVACALDRVPVGVDAEALGRLFRDGALPSATEIKDQGSEIGQTSPACRGGGPPSRAVEGSFRRQSPSGMDGHRPPPASETLLLRVLSEAERDWVLAGESPAQRDRRFTAVWTCKEAWGKARGVGFLYDLKSTCFLPTRETWRQQDCTFFHRSREAYELTLCSRELLPCESVSLEEIQSEVSL